MSEDQMIQDIADMSDEEFANYQPEPVSEVTEDAEETALDTETVDDTEVSDEQTEVDGTETDTEVTEETDYKAFYEAVTAKFKASGAELQVEDPTQIISLMQKGVNYNQKMQGLNKQRSYTKMLEEAELLDEGKLAFLIDLHKKNPDAVAKFVRESGIDMYEIDSEERAGKYTPTTSAPSAASLDLEDTLAEMQTTPSYQKTMDILLHSFDQSSRDVLVSKPSWISDLNQQVASGVYDQINAVMVREKALGNYAGVSDLDAYMQIGTQLHNQGKLLGSKPVKPVSLTSKPNTQLNNRRDAASSTPNKGTTVSKIPEDVLSMSDEEFAKLRF